MRQVTRLLSLLAVALIVLPSCRTRHVTYPVTPAPVVVKPLGPIQPVRPDPVDPSPVTPQDPVPAPAVGTPTKAHFDKLIIGQTTRTQVLQQLGGPRKSFTEAGITYYLYRVIMPSGVQRDAELQFSAEVLSSKLVGF